MVSSRWYLECIKGWLGAAGMIYAFGYLGGPGMSSTVTLGVQVPKYEVCTPNHNDDS